MYSILQVFRQIGLSKRNRPTSDCSKRRTSQIRVCTTFHSVCILKRHFSALGSLCLNFRAKTANFQVLVSNNMSCVMTKPVFWFQTRSDTNRTVQPQSMVSGSKFWILDLNKKVHCTIYVAKIKALISFVVTEQLICGFVLAYAKSWFSHDMAHKGLFSEIYFLVSFCFFKNFFTFRLLYICLFQT